ncbi:MAG: hypothetical protein CSB34_06130 [Desulfobulbus propionicus]|nr:MAG: hypothetical protein CSB34_06130 [Desulfobulbus propionicus]
MSSLHVTSKSAKSKKLPHGGQTRITCPPQIVAGLDKLEVSCYANNDGCNVWPKFEFIKKQIQEGFSISAAINFNDHPTSEEFFRWNLQRTGTKLFSYILRSGDLTLLLSPRSKNEKIPNVKIEIGSISCHQDAFGIYRKILMWLKCYGIEVEENIVSRVDLCVDTIGTSIDGLGASLPYRWITRGRTFIPYYSLTDNYEVETVQIGKGDIMLRVYNKIKELKKNQVKRDFFFDLWCFTEEQKKNPPPVTRTEFQLRRAVLKEFKIPVDSVEQLSQNLDAIWNYCTCDWAKLSNRSVHSDRKNNNQHLVPPSKFWQRIQQAIFIKPLQSLGRIKKNLHKNIEALKDQARGCLLNVAVAFGHEPKDYFGIIATMQEVVTDIFDDYMINKTSAFEKKFKMRRNEVFIGF